MRAIASAQTMGEACKIDLSKETNKKVKQILSKSEILSEVATLKKPVHELFY